MNFNIRFKLVVFTLAIVLLVGGSISLYAVFIGQRRMLSEFEEDARRTAALIAGEIVNDVYFLELRSLRHRLESSRLNSDIVYTLVMDLDGAVLSDGTPENVLRDQKATDPFNVKLLQANDWVSEVQSRLLKIGGPVLMPDYTRVGYVNVGFSLQRINEMVRENTRSALYVSAFAFGVAFVLAFALAANFIRPILTVTRAAKKIGQGRFETRLSVNRRDELGTLAESVNVMAETLQKRHAELSQSFELLEREVADRKQAEESLRESEERFRSLVSVITDVPWVTDRMGAFATPQAAWERYTGQSWEEHRGFGWIKALHPDDCERVKDSWNEACANRTVYQSEGRLWHDRSQRWRFVMFKATPLLNSERSVREWVGTCIDIDDQKQANQRLENMVAERTRALQQANATLLRDVAERKKLQEQLLQAQKMEGIGTLAGGIAHDFNNILNIIQAYASILGHGTHNQETGESLAVINETVHRGSSLVQQLLTLARKTSTHFECVDVNVLIQELISLIGQTFPKTIELSSVLEPYLPSIMADANQIEQALLNISVNARDAMPDGGSLVFKTYTVAGIVLQALGGSIDGSYVCIEVSDTGTGMNESIRKRVFEPFFTTKGIGKGSGLGLSVVYGIVQNHGGFINVESTPAAGTSFRLYFPARPSDGSRKDATVTPSAEATMISSHAATVLLIEDEQKMLQILETILLQRGYRVLKAADGEEALEVYRRHQGSIDAVLLDIGLPKISGRDVLFEIKNTNPDVSIIIASGYLEPELKAEVDEAGVNYFLQKPYMLDEVVKAVQTSVG